MKQYKFSSRFVILTENDAEEILGYIKGQFPHLEKKMVPKKLEATVSINTKELLEIEYPNDMFMQFFNLAKPELAKQFKDVIPSIDISLSEELFE